MDAGHQHCCEACRERGVAGNTRTSHTWEQAVSSKHATHWLGWWVVTRRPQSMSLQEAAGTVIAHPALVYPLGTGGHAATGWQLGRGHGSSATTPKPENEGQEGRPQTGQMKGHATRMEYSSSSLYCCNTAQLAGSRSKQLIPTPSGLLLFGGCYALGKTLILAVAFHKRVSSKADGAKAASPPRT